MARSLDLDALTEEDLLQLLEEILNRLPVRDLVTVRIAAEAKRHEKRHWWRITFDALLVFPTAKRQRGNTAFSPVRCRPTSRSVAPG
jgi:hypothetical protein